MHEEQAIGEVEQWAQLASRGDSEAAARVISANLEYWSRAACSIAGSRSEALDLVQDAVVSLLDLWQRGKGPAINTRSYVTTMMRNAHASRMRSPRSQTQAFDELDAAGLPAVELSASTDLVQETDAVHRALLTLSPEHRTVLLATIVQGQRPAELVEALGRSAPAISNLLVRAKHALHRGLLIDYLSNGTTECVENAQQLPKRVHERFELHEDSERSMRHVRECPRCQRNWRRFAAVSSTLGVLPLLALSKLPAAVDSAWAVENVALHDEPGGEQTESTQPSVGIASVGAAVAAPRATASLATLLTSKAAMIVGVILIVLAVATFLAQSFMSLNPPQNEIVYQGELVDSDQHGAVFNVALGLGDAGQLQTITVHFSVEQADSWSISELRLTLPPGVELRGATNGLSCASAVDGVQCQVSSSTNLGQPFVLEVDDGLAIDASHPHRAEFLLDITAEADNDIIEASARGSW